MIRHQFEVREYRILRRCRQLAEEKLHDAQTGLGIQVERAVDEFEQAGAACVQGFQLRQKHVGIERPCSLIQRRQAKFALERTAARRLHVERAMGDVFIAVQRIGRHDLSQRRLHACMHFHQGLRPVQNLPAQLRKSDVAPAGYQIVGQLHYRLFAEFIRHFRAAQHDNQLRCNPLQHGDDPGGFLDIPYIDAEADDARLLRQQLFDDVRRSGANHEFLHACRRLQVPHICQQVTQTQRSVRIAGIEGGQQNGHGLQCG